MVVGLRWPIKECNLAVLSAMIISWPRPTLTSSRSPTLTLTLTLTLSLTLTSHPYMYVWHSIISSLTCTTTELDVCCVWRVRWDAIGLRFTTNSR